MMSRRISLTVKPIMITIKKKPENKIKETEKETFPHPRRAEPSSTLGGLMTALSSFPPTSRILPSNLSLWNNHTFNEVKQCNYKTGTAILPLRYYNLKSLIKSLTLRVAHLLSPGICHLPSINPPLV